MSYQRNKFSNYAVIFDMDGMLVDNTSYHVKSWKEFLARQKLKITEDDIKNKFHGRTAKDIFRKLYGKNISDEQIRRYTNIKERIYRKIYGPKIKPVPGLKAAKRAGMKVIGITTTYSRKALKGADYIIQNFRNLRISNVLNLLD